MKKNIASMEAHYYHNVVYCNDMWLSYYVSV